jgi:exopolysaccharide biosynthesis polyprenyl glycosylphosphotransferase
MSVAPHELDRAEPHVQNVVDLPPSEGRDPHEGLRLERRQQGSPHRRSWASPEPFDLVPRASDQVDPRIRAARRRGSWMRPMTARAVASDLLTAAAVTGACLWSAPMDRRLAPMAMLLAGAVWAAAVKLADGYDAGRMGDGAEAFQAILRAALGVITGMGVLTYALQTVIFHQMIVAVPMTVVLTMALRHLLRQSLHKDRFRGRAMWRTLLVGDRQHVKQVSEDLRRRASHGFDVIGACAPATADGGGPGGVEVLGTVSEVPQVVVDHDVDAVIVVGSQLSGAALRRLSWALERTGAQLLVEPGLVEVAGPNVSLRPAAGLSLLHLEPPSSRPGRLVGKSVLDRLLGSFLLVLAAPVVAAGAVAVRLTSPGPAFFKQTRMGLDGRTFTMYKLRSMVADAEQRKISLLAQSSRDGLMFKMHSDPRVTRVGSFLRRYSIDELPQLLNVVRGDMSLVGPRPPLVSEYERYHDAVFRRLRVKPGLTGLWQVSGRADLSWEESVRLDLRYVDNWSLALDLLILWKTARAVLGRSGAY